MSLGTLLKTALSIHRLTALGLGRQFKVVYHRCWSLIFEIKILDVRLICSIHAPYSLLYEAVFELTEAGFKLNVTRLGQMLMQSV